MIPKLKVYQDGWPVLFYLKVTMHDHSSFAPCNCVKWKEPVADENCSRLLVQKHQKTFKQPGTPGITPGPLLVAGHGVPLKRSTGILQMQQAPHHDATHGASHEGDVIIISDSEDSVTKNTSPTTTASFLSLRSSSQATLCGSGPTSSVSSSLHHVTQSLRSILDMLVSGGIPSADAHILARLLASFRIATGEYLRALAQMQSHDVWLLELRAQKKVSEIQMRILHDILNGLAASEE
ncbi:hypothetical protein C8T65DRAFT_737559 [Cerioporus squamosus]|nr:hypothetical protein C8T65DRAFT_737559 [Cerioporus squamosus]